ncbi:4-alpha-glucanotransferase DPE2, partial [Tetrabaena socialis]
GGELVEVCDTWLDRSHPAALMASAAFTQAHTHILSPQQPTPDRQNWGFPTYDWQAMSADGYGWWRSRLQHLSQYFTAYRIDHVLGFFRIWE